MLRGARDCQPSSGRIPPEGACCREAMTGGKTETVNANARRRKVRVKRCAPSGCSNRRLFPGQPGKGKNPEGYPPGSGYDTGMPNNASCLEPEKSGYNGRRRLSSRMAEKNDRSGILIAERAVKTQVISPVRVRAKAGARSLEPTGSRLSLVSSLTEYWRRIRYVRRRPGSRFGFDMEKCEAPG